MQKEIYLYSQESSKNPTYFAVQGDTGRNLKCHIVDVDVASEVTSAQIYVKKPDGTNVYNNGTVNQDGTITVPITSQTLAAVGKAKAMLQLTGPDGYISTYEFVIKILETIIDEQAAESSDEWGALQEALYEVSTIGKLSDLLTTVKTSIVAAINELVGRINNLFTNQGDLDDLTTTHKDNLVNAINDAAENGGIAVQDTQPTNDVLAWVDSDALGADFCFVGDTAPAADGTVAVWVDTSEDEIPVQAGAEGVSYDNTDSGLTADNVQGAIDEIGTVKEQIIAGHLYAQAVGKVVTINGWVDGLTLPAGVQKGLGILNADIPKPTTVIRTVCNCGANAYSVGEQGYFGIDSSGNVFVTAKSNGNTTIYVSCSYIGA